MYIDGTTKTICVIGDPIEHTLSPEIQNFIIEQTGVNAVYTAYHILPGQVGQMAEAMRTMSIAGMNVTIPHKMEIMRYLDNIDDTAAAIGAVNTVQNRNGVLTGFNTDGEGFIKSLLREGVSPAGKTVGIWGAGGAVKGVVYVLLQHGAEKIVIQNRTAEKAEALAAAFGPKIVAGTVDDSCDILINATPCGMSGVQVNKSPFDGFDTLTGKKVVCDLIYNPRQTKLLAEAKRYGHQTINGLGMLIYQAVLAFELFTDVSVAPSIVDALFARLSFEKNVVLTGFMGSGKTTYGRKLAHQYALQFIDVDAYIAEKAGMSIPQIFAQFGEEHFRNLESETIAECAKMRGVVLALGGGAVLRRENIDLLRQNGIVLRLKRTLADTLQNLTEGGRPLASGKTPEQIEALAASREPFYENCDCTVLLEGRSLVQGMGRILDALHKNINRS